MQPGHTINPGNIYPSPDPEPSHELHPHMPKMPEPESAPQQHSFMHSPLHSSPPPPPIEERPALTSIGGQSVPVVKVLSIRGVEYAMMTIALWVTASSLGWILLNVINGSAGFDFVVVPTSALIICLPIFAALFLRLKKAEIANPELRLESSKRRLSQWTQILAFLAIIINCITFVYEILQKFGSDSKISLPKSFASLVVILVIAGGLLFYYWRDEHNALKR
jgi:hypothetical protein